MNATRHVSVSRRKPQETGPRGAAQYVAHFQQLRKVAALKAAPATSLHPQTPFCACSGFLPVLPLLLLLLLPLPLPSPRQNPNSIWMPANAKFVCRPNSWPFLLFWKLVVVVLLAFSSTSPLFYFILFPVWDSLAKAIGARGNNNQIKWHPELSLQEIRNAPMTAYPHSHPVFSLPPLCPSSLSASHTPPIRFDPHWGRLLLFNTFSA